MAKNPLANMLAQATTPGIVQAPPGKVGSKSTKAVAPPKGVQKSIPAAPSPGLPPPQPVAPRKGFGGGIPPANPFGKKR